MVTPLRAYLVRTRLLARVVMPAGVTRPLVDRKKKGRLGLPPANHNARTVERDGGVARTIAEYPS